MFSLTVAFFVVLVHKLSVKATVEGFVAGRKQQFSCFFTNKPTQCSCGHLSADVYELVGVRGLTLNKAVVRDGDETGGRGNYWGLN